MFASTDPMTASLSTVARPQRPISTRAALGVWAVASVVGWLAIAGLLRALGVI